MTIWEERVWGERTESVNTTLHAAISREVNSFEGKKMDCPMFLPFW